MFKRVWEEGEGVGSEEGEGVTRACHQPPPIASVPISRSSSITCKLTLGGASSLLSVSGGGGGGIRHWWVSGGGV